MLIDSQTGLFAELSPIVKRATQKMTQKYALRLSRRRVVCVEDLENIAWAQVLEQLERIARIPAGNERSKFVYTVVCHAIHSEMRISSPRVMTRYVSRTMGRWTQVRKMAPTMVAPLFSIPAMMSRLLACNLRKSPGQHPSFGTTGKNSILHAGSNCSRWQDYAARPCCNRME